MAKSGKVKISYMPGFGPKPKPEPRPYARTRYPFTALINGKPRVYTEPPRR